MKSRPALPKAYTENEVVRLVWLAIFISMFSFLFYNRRGDLLLYGDAVAHINIARRVFDSKTPGLLQLGTVWLPLPHLLILPFVISKNMWQSGMGGSFPSLAGFVLGVLGIFRLVRTTLGGGGLRGDGSLDETGKTAAWCAAVLYAANPNLIYIQGTAMGEALYLAIFIWSVVFLAEYLKRGGSRPLMRCGLCLFGACLTRYDGWFLSAVMVGVVVTIPLLAKESSSGAPQVSVPKSSGTKSSRRKSSVLISKGSPSRTVILKFILLAAAGPVLWLAYNAVVYRNPLEFANGPYSARAINQKTATVNPAQGNVLAAGSYFVKAAELNVSEGKWPGRLWLLLALLGSFAAVSSGRGRASLLLWIPLPFYALSVAYGSVPIFVPTWWPFSNYNVRYGLQLLPAFAVFVPMGISWIVENTVQVWNVSQRWKQWSSVGALPGVLILGAGSYAAIWHADPICYREAAVNMRGRIAIDRQLESWFHSLPADSTLLMYLGEHVGALEQAGIPLQRVINEGNHRVWKRPTDPEGLWERALANPAGYADYAVGFEGDPVWSAAKEQHLTAIVEIHSSGQPAAVIFQTRGQSPGPAAAPAGTPESGTAPR